MNGHIQDNYNTFLLSSHTSSVKCNVRVWRIAVVVSRMFSPLGVRLRGYAEAETIALSQCQT